MQAATKRVSVGCTMLANTGKQGILKPDANGYYTMVLGAYGTTNSIGQFYDAASGAAFFRPGSPLMRRLEKGVLTCEYKHPVKDPSWSHDQWINRLRTIDDDRECAHIRKLHLDSTAKDDEGRPIHMVLGELKPSGPMGDYLREKIDNPDQNVYFSVRSLTLDDLPRGIRYTKELITWDYVGEGGIAVAHKYRSPALEGRSVALEELVSAEVLPTDLWRIARAQQSPGVGMEASSLDVNALMKELGWAPLDVSKRSSHRFLSEW